MASLRKLAVALDAFMAKCAVKLSAQPRNCGSRRRFRPSVLGQVRKPRRRSQTSTARCFVEPFGASRGAKPWLVFGR